jgi:hypothetical protein
MLKGFKKFENKIDQDKVLRISKDGKLSITAKHREGVSRMRADIFFNDDTLEIAIKFHKSMELPYERDDNALKMNDLWAKRRERQMKQDEQLGGDFEVKYGELNLNPILREHGVPKRNESVAVPYRIEGDFYILSTGFLFADRAVKKKLGSSQG